MSEGGQPLVQRGLADGQGIAARQLDSRPLCYLVQPIGKHLSSFAFRRSGGIAHGGLDGHHDAGKPDGVVK